MQPPPPRNPASPGLMKTLIPTIGEHLAGSTFKRQGTPRQRKGRPLGQVLDYWLMECGECGSSFEIPATQVRHAARHGKKRLCNNRHLHTGVSLGDRFNKTVVVGWASPAHSSDHRWQCRLRCDCGTEHLGRPDQLKRGDIQSCGCRRAEVSAELKTTHGLSGSSQYKMFTGAKQRALKEGLPFDIELDDCKIPDVCPVLGIPFDLGEKDGQRLDASPSLDKFVPEKGYVKGNVAVISWLANRIKTNAKASDVMKVALWMQKNESSQ